MINLVRVAVFFSVISFSGAVVHAADFLGATVINREVPTSAWRTGVTGSRPIVEAVTTSSPAEQYGLKQGDIILSVNDKDVRNTNDLLQATADTLSVYVLDGSERKMLTIDMLAIKKEAEKKKAEAARIEAERKAAAMPPQTSTIDEEQAGDSPAATFDDTTLFLRTHNIDPDKTSTSGKDRKTEKEPAPHQTSRPSTTE